MGSNPHRLLCEAGHTKPVACRLGLARLPTHLLNDDSCDDNRDDSRSLNHHRYSTKKHRSCLVRVPARSWHCGGHVFESLSSRPAERLDPVES